ncbi:MAG: hypothetical protein QW478_07835 [Candidatus Micrarchaeaceae archaeon]
MKIKVIFLGKNKNLIVKKLPIDKDNIITYNNMKYQYNPDNLFIRKNLFNKEFVIVYKENDPNPIPYSQINNAEVIRRLIHTHVVSEWLADTSEKWIWYLLFLIFGVAIGIIIGIGIYPVVIH